MFAESTRNVREQSARNLLLQRVHEEDEEDPVISLLECSNALATVENQLTRRKQ